MLCQDVQPPELSRVADSESISTVGGFISNAYLREGDDGVASATRCSRFTVTFFSAIRTIRLSSPNIFIISFGVAGGMARDCRILIGGCTWLRSARAVGSPSAEWRRCLGSGPYV